MELPEPDPEPDPPEGDEGLEEPEPEPDGEDELLWDDDDELIAESVLGFGSLRPQSTGSSRTLSVRHNSHLCPDESIGLK